ncbi:MAG: hypothetical protein JWP27_3024 [Flaviaesturariibacter sp.]|nr:hypothetical protein [Flaviaesturariibacter sp.]
MHKQAAEVRYFLYSQAFADGVRITLAVLLPALIGSYTGWAEAGMAVALGALCVSLTDAPGPQVNKRNGMLICGMFVFFITILTGLTSHNVYLMGALIMLVTFFFSMFNVYGARAAAVGNAVVLAMILTMDKQTHEGILAHGAAVLFGGLFYMVISLAFSAIKPYRAGQRILGDCVREIAKYLSIKASFYDPSTDLTTDYKKLVAQQIVVNEKQDAVREILFKTRQIVRESTATGRKLIMTFVEAVDLFEDITATYYDYELVRKRFGETGVLEQIAAEIRIIARELDGLGMAIQMNARYESPVDVEQRLTRLKNMIDTMPRPGSESHLVLRKILVNLRRLEQRYVELKSYFEDDAPEGPRRLDHSHFVTHQPLDTRIFFNNLSFRSSVFKHSLRVAIACLLGYSLTKVISYGHHSYWILMTIAFMMKPAFSLTKQRNIERIIGTLAGGAIGIALLLLVHDRTVLFAIMVLFMLLNYSFLRINYLLTVLFTTPFVLILFTFYGIAFRELAQERLFDTVLGCAIAFAAGAFLFPSWEASFLNSHLQNMLKANIAYLRLILDGLAGEPPDLLRYKLVRKEVYVNSANLSAAFQRMISEPRNTQKNSKQIQQFIVLNHILFSNIATVATQLRRKEPRQHAYALVASVRKTISLLEESDARLGADPSVFEESQLPVESKQNTIVATTEAVSADDLLLKDQLDFVCRIASDLDKTITAIIS